MTLTQAQIRRRAPDTGGHRPTLVDRADSLKCALASLAQDIAAGAHEGLYPADRDELRMHVRQLRDRAQAIANDLGV